MKCTLAHVVTEVILWPEKFFIFKIWPATTKCLLIPEKKKAICFIFVVNGQLRR